MFCFGATPGNAWDLILAVQSGITPSGVVGKFRVPGIKPGPRKNKSITLPVL